MSKEGFAGLACAMVEQMIEDLGTGEFEAVYPMECSSPNPPPIEPIWRMAVNAMAYGFEKGIGLMESLQAKGDEDDV